MKNIEDKPASFIGKLCNILRSKENAKVIYWDPEEKGIRILNQKKLEEFILPKYYRHNRMASFVRQLNMYDFHKVHLGDHKSIFCHSEFDPRKKENIHLIRRKVMFNHDQVNNNKSDQTLKEISVSQNQQNENTNPINFLKPSTKMIIKHSLQNFKSQRLSEQSMADQILIEILSILNTEKCTNGLVKQRLKDLKKSRKFSYFLRKKSFVEKIYAEMGMEMDDNEDNLSELSIEQELMQGTNKSLTQKSMKMFESGPFQFMRDTVGYFMNF